MKEQTQKQPCARRGPLQPMLDAAAAESLQATAQEATVSLEILPGLTAIEHIGKLDIDVKAELAFSFNFNLFLS